jgi:hypothetical protein
MKLSESLIIRYTRVTKSFIIRDVKDGSGKPILSGDFLDILATYITSYHNVRDKESEDTSCNCGFISGFICFDKQIYE